MTRNSSLPTSSEDNSAAWSYELPPRSVDMQKFVTTDSDVDSSTSLSPRPCPEPMAIVGLSMRLPGRAHDAQQFWNMLVQKKSGLCDVPGDRYNISGFYVPQKRQGMLEMRQGYFLDGIDLPSLDTDMFPMPKKELQRLDPQQRQLLEVAYECMENAGQTNFRGDKIGCYIGVFGEDWLDLWAKETQHRQGYRVTGYGDFVLGNRISYEFDLRGPSMTVKTGCSSSLVCLDLACQAILKGDCSAALVGGINLILSPTMTIALSDQGVLSPSGSCKTFDASADGYGRGEAVNMIFVKKLSDAIRDGDRVRAVIRASQVNCDGRTNGMITPSTNAQEALIRSTYHLAGLMEHELAKTAFVECHGTGTAVGDPVEAKAIASCFGEQGVIITSVKPNVGHSEGAAGITSLIKCVLALEHNQVPPNINFTNPNTEIPFKEGKLRVPTEVEQWPEGRDERVSVNSFGIGGVNAHVILESVRQYAMSTAVSGEAMRFNLLESSSRSDAECDTVITNENFAAPLHSIGATECISPNAHLLLFSAANIQSLQTQVLKFQEYTRKTQNPLVDVAYSLACRRVLHRYRTYAVASVVSQSSWTSEAVEDSKSFSSSSPWLLSTQDNIIWMFTGQGAQWPGMGAKLLKTNTVFAKTIHRLDSYLQSLPDPPTWSIADELCKANLVSRVHNIVFGHPLSTAVQIALVDVLRSWGVKPRAVIGHSSGEIAAAYASGAITAEAAIATALLRGSIDKSPTKGGSMVAVGLGKEKVVVLLEPGVVVACENSHCSVTLSGDAGRVAQTIDNIKKTFPGAFIRQLHVEAAFHSHHVLEYVDTNQTILESIVTSIDPHVPFYSSVSGHRLAGDGCLDAGYWRSNMEKPVLFNTSLRSALHDHAKRLILIEIGAHPALHGPVNQVIRDLGRSGDVCLSTLRRGQDCHESLLHLAGKLIQQGVCIDVSAVCAPGRFVSDLPVYCWTHSSLLHWDEPRVAREWRFRSYPPHELLGTQVIETSSEPRWRNMISLDQSPWLAGHKINGSIVFPAAGYIAMIGEALRQLRRTHGPGYDQDQEKTFCVRNLQISAALVLDKDAAVTTEITTTLTPMILDDTEHLPRYSVIISSFNGSKWIRHCTGEAHGSPEQASLLAGLTDMPNSPLPRQVCADSWYRALDDVGYCYTGSFKALENITAATTSYTARATVDCASTYHGLIQGASRHTVHPTIIDQCLQLCIVARSNGLSRNCNQMALPTFIEEIIISPPKTRVGSRYSDAPSKLSITASISSAGRTSYVGSIVARSLNDSNDPILSFRGFKATTCLGSRDGHAAAGPTTDAQPHELLLSSVQWMPHADFANLGSYMSTVTARSKEWPLLEELAILSMIYCFRYLKVQPSNAAAVHLTKLLGWMQTIIKQYEAGENQFVTVDCGLCNLTNNELEIRMSQISHQISNISGSDYSAISTAIIDLTHNAADIFSGEASPLELLLSNEEDNILGRIYSVGEVVSKPEALRVLANTNPRLRVLEIGAGTGGTTATVLAMLRSSYGEPLYASYTYSDVSAGFLGAAKKRFSEARNITYTTLDISKNPEEQGFEPGSYDLIIASNVIHATPSLNVSLCNVRKLLAPRGRLFLQELCPGLDLNPNCTAPAQSLANATYADAIFIDYIMGFLPGWWIGFDDNRATRPHVSPERWSRELLSAGFQIPDAISLDVEKPYQACALFLATMMPQRATDAAVKRVSILCCSTEGPYVNELRNALGSIDIYVDLFLFGDPLPASQDVVSLVDLEAPVIHDELTKDSLTKLLGYLESLDAQQNLVWVTRSSQVAAQDPRYAMVLGLVRSCRNEMHRRIFTIEIDAGTSRTSATTAISNILSKIHSDAATGPHASQLANNVPSCTTKSDLDWEYAVDNDEILIPRFHWHTLQSYRSAFSPRSSLTGSEDKGNDKRVLRKLDMSRPGLLHTMSWAEAPSTWEPKPDEVLIRVKAVGLNFRDVLIALGVLENSTSEIGLEGSGEVEAVGSDVADLAIGDRVLYLSQGCFSTYMILSRASCVKFDRGMSFEAAASLPCAYATAVMALVDKAKLQKGQSVLIHSAAGGVGLAAIQVAKMIGARIYCTVGNDLKAEYVVQHHGIPRSDIFYSRDATFQYEVMQATNNRGVDVVLNSLSGDLLHASWKCVAEFGTMVEIGKRDFRRRSKLSMELFEQNRAFVGLDLFSTSTNRPEVTQKSCTTEAALSFKIELESYGCQVALVQGDVSNPDDVNRAVQAAPSCKPIAGIMNLSMVLKDVPLCDMTHEDWVNVTRPKVQGTWNLHNAVASSKVDFFILFSSYSGITGAWGQGNYASASTFLDSFVQYRYSLGLPASVVDIGCVGDVGTVAVTPQLHQHFKRVGLCLLKEQQLLEVLTLAVELSQQHVSFLGKESHYKQPNYAYTQPNQIIFGLATAVPIDSPQCQVHWKHDSRAAIYHNVHSAVKRVQTGSTGHDGSKNFSNSQCLLHSLTESPDGLLGQDTTARIADAVREQLCVILTRQTNDIRLDHSLASVGVDSLVAIELRNWIGEKFDVDISVFAIVQSSSLLALGEAIRVSVLAQLHTNVSVSA